MRHGCGSRLVLREATSAARPGLSQRPTRRSYGWRRARARTHPSVQLQLLYSLSARQRPGSHLAVVAARGEERAVRVEVKRVDRALVVERLLHRARVHVPQCHRLASCRRQKAVVQEGDGVHDILVHEHGRRARGLGILLA
jgi:hypothetical protein